MAILTMLNQVFVLFLLMGIGFILSKSGVVDKKGSDQMTTLLCYIVLPCAILNSFQMEFTYSMLHNFAIMCAITFGIHVFNILASQLIFNKKRVIDNEQKCVLQFSSIYSNTGFMGFPLLEAMAGKNGLFYGSAYNSVFGLFLWTQGFLLYSRKLDKKSILKAFLNPNIIASVIGLFLYCFSLKLPGPIYLSVKYLAQLNTGLSMIVIGTTMTQISFRKMFKGIQAWECVVMRNLILPFALLFILYAIGLRGQLLLCSVIPAACPVAGFSVLFAKLTGKNVAFPCQIMTLSTISSLFTMPFILGVISLLL